MMNKSKVKLRVVSLFLIAMFLLIPLLSSPVAATTQWYTYCSAYTDNTPPPPFGSGPTASVNIPPSAMETWNLDNGTIDFVCNYTFQDNYPDGSGSNHYVNLTVQRTSPTTGPIWTCDYFCYIAPVGQTINGQLSLSDTFNNTGYTWNITVYGYCEDCLSLLRANAGPNTYTWSI